MGSKDILKLIKDKQDIASHVKLGIADALVRQFSRDGE